MKAALYLQYYWYLPKNELEVKNVIEEILKKYSFKISYNI